MAGRYEIWLTNDYGLRLALLDDTLWFNASRIVNRIGYFSGGFKKDFDIALVKPDYMIQVWRAPQGGRLLLWRAYLIRKWRYETAGSEEHLRIEGPCINDLLRRRIVAAYAGEAQTDKTDYADDMMKEVTTESLADGVAPVPDAGTRTWGDLSVAPQFALGPTLTKAFAFRKLLEPSGAGVLSGLAQAARKAGTEVFFDIVPNVISSAGITFQFRTYINQPGRDVSARVIFDQEYGNLTSPFLEYDYTREENYVYSGGQGQGTARNIQQVYDATRYGISQWGRCEGFADARMQSADNGVREAGRAQLEERQPRRRLGGTPIDTEGTRFGRNWDFGYRVTARYRGQEFNAIIRAVVISVGKDGREAIQARVEYED